MNEGNIIALCTRFKVSICSFGWHFFPGSSIVKVILLIFWDISHEFFVQSAFDLFLNKPEGIMLDGTRVEPESASSIFLSVLSVLDLSRSVDVVVEGGAWVVISKMLCDDVIFLPLLSSGVSFLFSAEALVRNKSGLKSALDPATLYLSESKLGKIFISF